MKMWITAVSCAAVAALPAARARRTSAMLSEPSASAPTRNSERRDIGRLELAETDGGESMVWVSRRRPLGLALLARAHLAWVQAL
jgi:hypothetical protein